MTSNTRYLYERAAKLYFNAYGVKKDNGVKFACGVAAIPHDKVAKQTISVPFGSFFTPGCKPIITLSIVSSYNRRVIPTTHGLSGTSSSPDHRGFACVIAATELNSKTNYFVKTMHLHWMAMGY